MTTCPHQRVPDNLRPDEPDQVGTAVAVPEHPAVVPGGVELAEVPTDHPGLRLVRVRAQRPLVGQLSHVVVQRVEQLLGHPAGSRRPSRMTGFSLRITA